MKTSNKLAKLIKDDAEAWKRERAKLPVIIAQESVDFFQDNFRKGGFVDGSLKKWKPRKREDKTYKRKGTKRAILVKSGRLRRSVRRLRLSNNQIVIGSTVKYSPFHNYGAKKTPQRRFVGPSKTLSKEIDKIIAKRIDKAFRK